MKKYILILDIFSNSNLKMLADGHNIHKGAEFQLIPTLNRLAGLTQGHALGLRSPTGRHNEKLMHCN